METLAFIRDLLIDADGGRPVGTLVARFNEFGADAVVIEEDAGFP